MGLPHEYVEVIARVVGPVLLVPGTYLFHSRAHCGKVTRREDLREYSDATRLILNKRMPCPSCYRRTQLAAEAGVPVDPLSEATEVAVALELQRELRQRLDEAERELEVLRRRETLLEMRLARQEAENLKLQDQLDARLPPTPQHLQPPAQDSPGLEELVAALYSVEDAQPSEPLSAVSDLRSSGTDLSRWQQQALDAWNSRGRRGVVEAVTGAGKTRLAIAALNEYLQAGKKAVVVVPSLDLVAQWRVQLLRNLSGSRVRLGQMGGGGQDSLHDCDVLIATAQSAFQWELLPEGMHGMLIADEVHHYGAERWSAILEPGFEARLGLTATYERDHSGYDRFLDPYFGGVVFQLGYEEALKDGVIVPFRIGFVGTRFTSEEAEAYAEADEKVRRKRSRLINEFGLPAEPFGDFMRAVNRLARGADQAGFQAGFYLSAFNRRRAVLAGASMKLARLRDLAPSVRGADKSIVFSQTKQAAAGAIDELAQLGVSSALLTSDMHILERKAVLAGFEDGTHELVAAPKLLDEGIDVAAADFAIILAASRSRRQMIQRMGRVLRPKRGTRRARIAVLFVEGTAEDPRVSQESFLELIAEAAEDIRYFKAIDAGHELSAFFKP